MKRIKYFIFLFLIMFIGIFDVYGLSDKQINALKKFLKSFEYPSRLLGSCRYSHEFENGDLNFLDFYRSGIERYNELYDMCSNKEKCEIIKEEKISIDENNFLPLRLYFGSSKKYYDNLNDYLNNYAKGNNYTAGTVTSNISQKNGVYDFKLSNTPATSGVYLVSAGVTDIEQELNECVKNKDCQIPSSNNDDKKDDNNTNSTIACAYQYEMNGAKQCVVFTFEKGKNDSKYSLTTNDTSYGIKKYRNDEAVYNSSIPDDYLDGTKCFNELYLINHNEQYLWVNSGNPAFDYYGTPITMKKKDVATCNDSNKNDDSNNTNNKNNDMDLSGCIIDKGTQSIIDWIMNLIRIGGVILLVVLGMLDFVKAAASGEQEEMKKSKSKFVKRLIACVVLFFVPIIVKILVGLVNLGSGESCKSNDSTDKTDDSNNRVSYQCSCKYYRSNVDEPNISDVSLSFDVTNKDNFDSHTINYNGKNVTVKINSPQKNATSSTDMLCPKKCSFDESKKVLTCSSTDNDETFQNNNPHFYQAADENGKLLENCKILSN